LTETLLETKLFIPTTRPKRVYRSHLIEKLNEGLHRKLTFISAPAGFGKTTLVTDWLLEKKNDAISPIGIAWFSIEASDNDPIRFLTYLSAALNRVTGIETPLGEGVLSMLQSPQPLPIESILKLLINEISSISEKIILVLDDYHLIETPPIHKALTFLFNNQPQNLHIVITTRKDPFLPLSRLRAKDQLTELRAADLRFASSEAIAFLNRVMDLSLSEEDATALEIRTEGWITGLQLAAISLQGQEDTSKLIQLFSGSNRLVLDYLIEEVLNHQPKTIQTFLLKTSILNRFTGSLCDALTGQENGHETLEMLERENLFIIPLDDERNWYRYHHLFADLLRKRLGQRYPKEVTDLQVRAGEWHEENGLDEEAIGYAFGAADSKRAARLIEKNIDALWLLGQHGKLRSWLIQLPDEYVSSKPNLYIFRALYYATSGQQEAAEIDLQSVEKVIESVAEPLSSQNEAVTLSDPDKKRLRGSLYAVKAFMVVYSQKNVPDIIMYSRKALENLSEQDLAMRTIAAIALGDTYASQGDMNAAHQAQLNALDIITSTGNVYFLIVANLKLAVILRQQGKLKRTAEICSNQMDMARRNRLSRAGIVGWLLSIWGEVLAEMNDMDQALILVKKGLGLRAHNGDVAMDCWCHLCQIRVMYSRGDLDGIEESIQSMAQNGRESSFPPWYTAHLLAWQTRIWLAQDNIEVATHWAQKRELVTDGGLKLPRDLDYSSLFEYVAFSRVLLAQGQVDDVSGLLPVLLDAAEIKGQTSRAIEVVLLQALAFQAKGEIDKAIILLEKAISIAKPKGFFRIFVDEGPQMARLLLEALTRDISRDYVRKLLAAFPSEAPKQTPALKQQDADSEWVEPLSDREIEVLQLIGEGLSNKEIANRLFLAQSTVKVHTRNIYNKLGIHNRINAVTKAKALGILPLT
jgi:LuxR family transcriptional regulator, maltose regulon positive regulatory protein